MTPASAETVHRPHNTTTPSTSSAFIGIRPYSSIQPPLGIQLDTSSIFHKFPVSYLECMGQASWMQLWIHYHNNNFRRGTVSITTDWVGLLSKLDFLVLDGRFLQKACWHWSKKADIRDAFVVKHHKQGRTVCMSCWFPYLLVYWLTGSMITDLLCYVD